MSDAPYRELPPTKFIQIAFNQENSFPLYALDDAGDVWRWMKAQDGDYGWWKMSQRRFSTILET